MDGTDYINENSPNGNFLNPSVIDNVKTDMECYKEEIFGPVLCIIRVETLEQAIEIVNNNQYGNGTSVFTKSGSIARKCMN